VTASSQTLTQPLVIRKDPRIKATDADLARQFDFARQIQAERVRVAAARAQADSIRKQLSALKGKPAGNAASEIESFTKKFDAIVGPPPAFPEEDFFAEPPIDPSTLRRLATAFQQLARAVESADAAPTPDLVSGFHQRLDSLNQTLPRWEEFLRTDLPHLNASFSSAGVPTVQVE